VLADKTQATSFAALHGKDFDLHRIHSTYQEGEGGIADALRLAEPFVEGEKMRHSWRQHSSKNNIIASKEASRSSPAALTLSSKSA